MIAGLATTIQNREYFLLSQWANAYPLPRSGKYTD